MTLYRQHRPAHFADLIGQDTARQILQQALLKDRIAHAYLFSGPRGTGKTSTARIFTRAACCEAPIKTKHGFEPCDHCKSCVAIFKDRTSDVIEVDAASNRGIEDIRSLREQAQYPPSQLKYRVYIIDEVHMLTTEAFNALLKTLEEPPAHCLFILATTDLHKLPATVRSRCQLIRFDRANIDSIVAKLSKIVATDTLSVDADVLPLIAQAATGGFRDAETILEQLSTQHAHVDMAVATSALGTIEPATCTQLLDAVLSQNAAVVQQLLDTQFTRDDIRYPWVLEELVNQLRARQDFSPRPLFFLERLFEAIILQKSSPIPRLPLEIACFATVNLGAPASAATPIPAAPATPLKPIVQTKPAPEEKPPTTVTVTVKPEAVPAPQSVPVVELRETDAPTADLRKVWREVIDALSVKHIALAELLKQVAFHMVDGQTLHLQVRYKFHLEKLSEKKNAHLVEDQLKTLTGTEFHVVYALNPTMPKMQPRKQLSSNIDENLQPANVSAVFSTNPS